MKGGVDLQKKVHLLVHGPAKMKIIHGEGPINLVGSHCVKYESDSDSDSDTPKSSQGWFSSCYVM